MKAMFVVIFIVLGSAAIVNCRSLPAPAPPSNIDVASLKGNPVQLVRKSRQFGYGGYGGYGGYNNFDFNPYNDSPNNYDGNPFNDSPHRRTYNNFDLNPFNNSPNNYDLNPFNNSNFFGKKKK